MKAKSKCPRCSNDDFEAVIEKPLNSKYEFVFVRCTSCKIVVGVVDYHNIGDLVKQLAKKLNLDLEL